jgi:hypothetical protein
MAGCVLNQRHVSTHRVLRRRLADGRLHRGQRSDNWHGRTVAAAPNCSVDGQAAVPSCRRRGSQRLAAIAERCICSVVWSQRNDGACWQRWKDGRRTEGGGHSHVARDSSTTTTVERAPRMFGRCCSMHYWRVHPSLDCQLGHLLITVRISPCSRPVHVSLLVSTQ